MKNIKKVTMILVCLLFISSLVYANSASFELDEYNKDVSSKGNLWYYSGPYKIDVGVQNFSGGRASFNFKQVKRLQPDTTLVSLYLDSNKGNYFAGVADVNDQSGYYYEVIRISGRPAGNIFAR